MREHSASKGSGFRSQLDVAELAGCKHRHDARCYMILFFVFAERVAESCTETGERLV